MFAFFDTPGGGRRPPSADRVSGLGVVSLSLSYGEDGREMCWLEEDLMKEGERRSE